MNVGIIEYAEYNSFPDHRDQNSKSFKIPAMNLCFFQKKKHNEVSTSPDYFGIVIFSEQFDISSISSSKTQTT